MTDQEEQRCWAQQQSVPDVRLPAEAAPRLDDLSLPDESPCFPIHTTRSGRGQSPPFRLNCRLCPALFPPLHRLGGINLIVKRIGAQLIADGYVTTRIGIPLSGKRLALPDQVKNFAFDCRKLIHCWMPVFEIAMTPKYLFNFILPLPLLRVGYWYQGLPKGINLARNSVRWYAVVMFANDGFEVLAPLFALGRKPTEPRLRLLRGDKRAA